MLQSVDTTLLRVRFLYYVHAAHCDMLVSPSGCHVGKFIMKWAFLIHWDYAPFGQQLFYK